MTQYYKVLVDGKSRSMRNTSPTPKHAWRSGGVGGPWPAT